MDSRNWFPRIMCFAESCGDSMVYFGSHEQVIIKGHASAQQELLRLCTGFNSAAEILDSLASSYDRKMIDSLMQTLHEQGVVADSRNCWRHYHQYGTNPMAFFSPPPDEQLRNLYRDQSFQQEKINEDSALLKLLCQRESTRTFSDQPVNRSAVEKIACAGYGITGALSVMDMYIGRRTVPSAGALYPLQIHVVIRQPQSMGGRGVYVFDGVQLVKIKESFDERAWKACFLDDVYVETHAACFIISADIERHTTKYADRGYRYAILEAGHVAQNMILACTEAEIGCVEIGGFYDNALSHFFSHSSSIPITTLFIGHRS